MASSSSSSKGAKVNSKPREERERRKWKRRTLKMDRLPGEEGGGVERNDDAEDEIGFS